MDGIRLLDQRHLRRPLVSIYSDTKIPKGRLFGFKHWYRDISQKEPENVSWLFEDDLKRRNLLQRRLPRALFRQRHTV